jgi:hypothetical protein
MFKNTLEKRNENIENRQSSLKSKVLYILFSVFYSLNIQAQCAMCRASLESEGNAMKAEAVNDGIVYLMVIPYVLVGIVGVVVYRMYTKKKQQE